MFMLNEKSKDFIVELSVTSYGLHQLELERIIKINRLIIIMTYYNILTSTTIYKQHMNILLLYNLNIH